MRVVHINWRASARWHGFLSYVRADSSMIAGLDCVGIHAILLHVRRSLTGGRWAWTRPHRGRESRLADGLARDETVRQVSLQSGCVRALCCSRVAPQHRLQPRTMADACIHLDCNRPDASGKDI